MKWISKFQNSAARSFFICYHYLLLALRYKVKLKGMENLNINDPNELGHYFFAIIPAI